MGAGRDDRKMPGGLASGPASRIYFAVKIPSLSLLCFTL